MGRVLRVRMEFAIKISINILKDILFLDLYDMLLKIFFN